MNKFNSYNRNHISPFLGIGEGKRRKAKAEAREREEAAKRKTALELERMKQQTLKLEMEAAAQGFEPDKATRQLTLQQGTDTTLYLIIGGIVVAVMLAVYFIKKR